MIEVHSKVLRISGRELLVEAALNNCSGVWTATVREGERLVTTAAGSSPEDALANAAERAAQVEAQAR